MKKISMEKVRPEAFALEERTQQGLVIFRTSKKKVKFSVSLGANVDTGGFLKESFSKEESGYLLSAKILKSCGLKIKSGSILSLNEEGKGGSYLSLNNEESKDIKVTLLELLGLWSIKNFTLYASTDFIEECRDVTVTLKNTNKPLGYGLHKKYGQKYLM